METKNLNLLGLIGLIGSIILIIGVFVDWGTLDFGSWGKVDLTGWDFYNKEDGVVDGVDYTYVPLVALICGILSLLLMILPTFVNMDKYKMVNDILGIITLILALIVIICSILFYTQSLDFGILGKHDFTDVYDIGAGYWLTLAGAIITFIGGFMPIVKNKLLH